MSKLFPNEPLYCEGKRRPFFRGKFHLSSLLFFPIALYLLYRDVTNPQLFWLGAISLSTNVACFTISGLYHVFDWSPTTELFLQKMDHTLISLWCAGMMLPIAFVLLPTNIGVLFFSIITIAFLFNMDSIWNHCCPSIVKSSAIPASLLLFVPQCYIYMNSTEWVSMWMVYLFQIAGTIAYKAEQYSESNDLFGYHELFHLLSLFAAFFVFVVNYSIVSRKHV
jgi:hemolysin III